MKLVDALLLLASSLTTIRQAHTALSSQACKLIPRLLIPRSSFPLAWWCQPADPPSNFGTKLFAAHIDVLEREAQDRCSTASVVLLAECAQDKRYYAIENVEQGIYALCALGSCFTARSLELLRDAPQVINDRDARKVLELPTNTGAEWWQAAIVRPQDPAPKYAKAPSTSAEIHGLTLSLPKIRPRDNLPRPMAMEQSSLAAEFQDEGPSQAMVAAEPFQEPDEVFNLLKSQYQDALYTSKVRQHGWKNIGVIADVTKGISRILCKGTTFSGSCLVSGWL